MPEPILQYEGGFSCRTPRPETFQHVVGSLVRPAVIVADRRGAYDFQVEHLQLEHLEITVLSYGDPVEVDLRQLGPDAGESLVLQLIVAGSRSTHFDRGGHVDLYRSRAHLVASDTPMRVRCGRHCRHFLVRFDRSAAHATALAFDRPLRLPDPKIALSLASPEGRALQRYVRYLASELAHGGPLRDSGHFARATEQSLLTLVIETLMAATDAKPPGRIAGPPLCVRRAEQFIEHHLDEDIGIQDIVTSSGASLRTLYRCFEHARGVTPLGYLRERRLEEAHAELLHAAADQLRVSDVAFRWGFSHLSDFASRYRDKFGLLQSETLRQRAPDRQ